MRIVSWNVNGIRAGVRHGFVDFVDRSGADIVGVQEVRARPEDIPPAARRPPGWHTAFTVAERRGYSGVGLYSKLQPVRVDTSLGVPRFDREGRFMGLTGLCGRSARQPARSLPRRATPRCASSPAEPTTGSTPVLSEYRAAANLESPHVRL